jgi:uncharacterized protein (DUF1919 family)
MGKNMKKIAVFVEGQTEQIFVDLLIRHLFGHADVDKKKRWEAERTVHGLDYDNLYLNVRTRNNSLNELLTCLDELIP